MYSDKVLDHFHHPRNVGEIENATTVVEVTNPVCGVHWKKLSVVSGQRSVISYREKAISYQPSATSHWP